VAEIFTDEGLDDILNVYFRNTQAPRTTLYAGLFTSQTPSTVPARTATGGAVPSGWTEMVASSGTYARQAIPAAAWDAPATNGSGRRIVETVPELFTGFVGAAPANGFFIATAAASGAGDVILFFSNFDSGVERVFGTTSDALYLIPRAQLDG
jgi:hypothetical protein